MFKSLPQLSASALLVRPSVLVAMVWLCVWSVAFIGYLLSVSYPPGGESLRVLSSAQFTALTIGNGLLLAGLALDSRLARSSPRGLRRAHSVGLLSSALLLALFQYGLMLAWQPIAPG